MREFSGDCLICERASGEREPVGGYIHRDAIWSVCVADGFEVPGWLFVELHARHAEGPWSLRPAEAATLGPMLTRVSQAIRGCTGAERVYWMAFGELMPHFHVLLTPRLPDTPADQRSAALFAAREELRDVERAAALAADLRAAMAAPGG